MSILVRKLLPFILIICSILISYLCLKVLSEPFVWIAALWIITLVLLIRLIQYDFLKKLFLSLVVIVFILGAIELYYNISFPHDSTLARGDILEEYSVYDEILGYRPKKNDAIPVAKYYGDELVYKATYTMNKDGLRIGPEISRNQNSTIERCVVFFGGSFTFGRGVEDYETIPYLVTKESNGSLRTYNLAFSGYGPHQMLAMIENGLEQDVIDCKPDVGIYQGIVHHVARVNGHVNWDVHGPRYLINESGEVFLDGHFDDVAESSRNSLIFKVQNRLHQYLSKSKFYSETYKNVLAARNLNNFVDLYLGVVEKSRTIFENRYPDSEFIVIFWDDPDYYNKYTKKILEGFRDRGIKVFPVSEMLPGYIENKFQYELSPYDSHPNPKAYELISEYTLQNILK